MWLPFTSYRQGVLFFPLCSWRSALYCSLLLSGRLCNCVDLCAPCGLKSAFYMLTLRCQDSLTPGPSDFMAGWPLSHHPAFSGQPTWTVSPFCQKRTQNWSALWGNWPLLLAGVWIRITSGEGNLDYLAFKNVYYFILQFHFWNFILQINSDVYEMMSIHWKFITALFILAKGLKQPKCLSIRDSNEIM